MLAFTLVHIGASATVALPLTKGIITDAGHTVAPPHPTHPVAHIALAYLSARTGRWIDRAWPVDVESSSRPAVVTSAKNWTDSRGRRDKATAGQLMDGSGWTDGSAWMDG